MNFKNILNDISASEADESLSSRRHVLRSFGSKVALAALPFAIGSLFNKTYGQTGSKLIEALNLALEIDYMQYNFYHIANNTGDLIPPSTFSGNNDTAGFRTIEQQQLAHINFLKTTITALGGVPFTPKNYNPLDVNPPFVPSAYDFTARKSSTYAPIFVNVFASYPKFLMLAQLLEDVAVKAYAWGMQDALGNTTILTQMFQLQTTEARHAAHVRLMRRLPDVSAPETPSPWIVNNIPPTIPLQSYYLGEDNTIQNDISLTTLPGTGGSNVTKIGATAGFDEPITRAAAYAFIDPFRL
ncbi:MAG: ferritin-like domain-containing protein [Bacteroidota bacterium]